MNKKAVLNSIGYAIDNQWLAADQALAEVPRAFAVKRLSAYLAHEDKRVVTCAQQLADRRGLPLRQPSGSAPTDIDELVAFWQVSDAETLRENIDEKALSRLSDPVIGPLERSVELDISHAPVLEPFALAALGSQACRLRSEDFKIGIRSDSNNPSNKFAYALGLNEVWGDGYRAGVTEEERTIALEFVQSYADMERFSQSVSERICPDDPETRSATKYCLIELIRNVLDHSGSVAVVCAQYMRSGRGGRTHDGVQVAVADWGLGLKATLEGMHDWVSSDSIAMTAALSPFVSRTFPEGDFNQMKDNAGLGLYFIHEIVKRSDGRLLLWSGDHARIVIGDTASEAGAVEREVSLPRFSGMLAAVEFQIGLIEDYEEFFEHLRENIYSLIEIGKEGKSVLVQHHNGPQGIQVRDLGEDTAAARKFRLEVLIPEVHRESHVYLDFDEYEYLSPSFAHALMHEAIREAALSGATIAVSGASRSVWNTLRQVQRYALAGARVDRVKDKDSDDFSG